jgi:multidrug resistance efflux pump
MRMCIQLRLDVMLMEKRAEAQRRAEMADIATLERCTQDCRGLMSEFESATAMVDTATAQLEEKRDDLLRTKVKI